MGGCLSLVILSLLIKKGGEGLHNVGHVSVATGRGEFRIRSFHGAILRFFDRYFQGIHSRNKCVCIS